MKVATKSVFTTRTSSSIGFVNAGGGGTILPENIQTDLTIYTRVSSSRDGRMLALHANNTTFRVYDMDDFAILFTNSAIGTVESVEFSPDNSLMAVVTSITPFLRVYDTSTWTLVSTGIVAETTTTDAKFSSDGSKLVWNGNTDSLYMVNTSDWSDALSGVTLTPSVSITATQDQVIVNTDGSIIGCVSNIGRLVAFNAVTGAEVFYGLHHVGFNNMLRVSPDGTKLATIKDSDRATLSIFTLSDWSSVEYSVPKWGTTQILTCCDWFDDDTLIIGGGKAPGIQEFNLTTGEFTTVSGRDNTTFVTVRKGQTWEVNGAIDESVAESQWLCTAHDLETGTKVGSVVTSTASFTIPVGSPDALKVTVEPVPFPLREDATTYSLNDQVYPSDPQTTPYYYKCTTAGTTTTTEPTWTTTAGSTLIDGTVVWELVERINQPITHAPIIPTVA